MTERTAKYRGYVLVARTTDLGAKCWAWRDQTAVHKVVGGTMDEAILAVCSAIDADLGAAQREGTEADAAYVHALEAILPRLTESQRKMLQAHYRAPDRTMSASQLAQAAGYASYSGANLQYGIVGKAILEQHPMEVRKRADGTPIYTFALADEPQCESAQSGDVDGAEWRWQMLPALAHALRVLGVVTDA